MTGISHVKRSMLKTFGEKADTLVGSGLGWLGEPDILSDSRTLYFSPGSAVAQGRVRIGTLWRWMQADVLV